MLFSKISFRKAKFVKKFAVLAFTFSIMSQSITAFDGPTHRFVTEQSYEIVSDLDENLANFYAGYAEIMSDFSVKPDEDEDGTATAPYKDHFYNYATEMNYIGEKTSALTKLSLHYQNAKQCYVDGKFQESMQELSRGAHFLQDLSTPVHTFYESAVDATLKLPMHTDFEKKCNEIVADNFDVPDISENYLEKFKFNTVRFIGVEAACLSSDNLSAYYLNEHISDLQACQNAVDNAIHATSGLLYKFAIECLNPDKNIYIRSDLQ